MIFGFWCICLLTVLQVRKTTSANIPDPAPGQDAGGPGLAQSTGTKVQTEDGLFKQKLKKKFIFNPFDGLFSHLCRRSRSRSRRRSHSRSRRRSKSPRRRRTHSRDRGHRTRSRFVPLFVHWRLLLSILTAAKLIKFKQNLIISFSF